MLLVLSTLACATPDEDHERIELIAAEPMRVRMFSAADRARLYNFWATWCGPCKEEIPRLRAWAGEHPEIEVIMVSLDLPSLRKKRVEPFLHKQGIAHLTHWQLDDPDPARALARIVPSWPDTVPVTLLVSEEGEITKRFHTALTDADLAALP
ncbi:MAG TPA: TlpA family protein disulfide reductase [Deltaproteobacteria bacterium]|nr:TlpA family protein disulfide reductase [Deltaproteobacteria bacterium]